MGRLRYIGSKVRLVSQILDIAGLPGDGRFLDVFSGTGIVSREAANRGWPVYANDHLISSSIVTTARLLSRYDVSFSSLGGYSNAIDLLNDAQPIPGFIFQEYSPSGLSFSGHKRRYFSEQNGKKIDAIRDKIREWEKEDMLTTYEKALLVADLIEAANKVANIAGTYGCFLSHWTQPALRNIVLIPRELLHESIDFEVLNVDAFELIAKPDDLVYLDPPYTKRQYAAYYHLLETIAVGDKPEVIGVTGLRPWEHKSSPFCYKKQALDALLSLVVNLGAKRTIISYSSEGHINLSDFQKNLQQYGAVKFYQLADIGRYRPNQKALQQSSVTEYLIDVNLEFSKKEPELCFAGDR